MNVKKNDTVLVLTGKYHGKQGKVVATSPKENKIVVEGVNLQKKHEKARRANEVSKITEAEGPIDASNVLVVCDTCKKATRVKHSLVEGKKVRVCAKCGAVLDKAYTKATKPEAAESAAPKKRIRKRTAKAEASEEKKDEE